VEKLSLSAALRFLLSGAVAFSFLYACDPVAAGELLESAGTIGATLIVLVAGSVIYLFYRPLVYDTLLVRVQDALRRKSDNYRTFLKKNYDLSTSAAQLAWFELRDRHFIKRYEHIHATASGIHLLYISAVLGIAFGVWQTAIQRPRHGLALLGFSAAAFAAGFLLDRDYENRELGLLKSLPRQEVDCVASLFSTVERDASAEPGQ
jgi:hypothetical protein